MKIRPIATYFEDSFFVDEKSTTMPCYYGVFREEELYSYNWEAAFKYKEDAELFLKLKETK